MTDFAIINDTLEVFKSELETLIRNRVVCFAFYEFEI